jgi:hypothetical protein
MKIQARAGSTSLYLDDSNAGEGLSIYLSQSSDAQARWNFEVYAKLDSGENYYVGQFDTTNPGGTTPPGKPTRLVAIAVCPGATSWSVIVTPSVGAQAAPNEVANVTLSSSKCCTAPAGLQRVGERYSYRAGVAVGAVPFIVTPGRVITRITALGVAPGGSVQLGTGEDIVTVPAGVTVVFEPKAPLFSSAHITLTNVNWQIEYLDSA